MGSATRVSSREKGKGVRIVEWDEGEVEEDQSKLALCLVGKLWTTKKFNAHAFMIQMEKLWNPAHGMEAKEIADKGFLFQFCHWRDKERVLDGEPWLFDRCVVVLKEITEDIKPPLMGESLTHAPFWVRVYDPPFKGRHEHNMRAIANSIGSFIKSDEEQGWSKSLRFKALMDLREPFTKEVILSRIEGREAEVQIKYERLPNICYYCGRLGHVERDCEEKGAKEDEGGTIYYEYGEWMRASPWNTRKGVSSFGKGKSTPVRARQLIFQPRSTKEKGMKTYVNDMADGLSNIVVSGGENENLVKEGVNGEMRGDNSNKIGQEEEVSSAGQQGKKSSWRRLLRNGANHKGREGGGEMKRQAGVLLEEDERPYKKVKEGGDEGDNSLYENEAAEAEEQPRREP